MDTEVTNGDGSIKRKGKPVDQLPKTSEKECEGVTQEGGERGNNMQG